MADHGHYRVRYALLSIVLVNIMMLYYEIHMFMIIKCCVDLLVKYWHWCINQIQCYTVLAGL